MRLTLRTLLAYLDGILEPNDAQDLGKKIEESEYATNLVHRIRDVMRRLRLGAPSPTDRGPGFDPNTVAEYLDNSLSSERVADFEKVCLDSDVHLAEVAACHQILTLVLGEPAEVEPACRDRVYQIKETTVGAKLPPLPPASALPASTTVPSLDLTLDEMRPARQKSRPRPTVPEYLREPRKRPAWLPIGAAVVLAACVAIVVLMSLGQLEPGTVVGDLLVRWGVVAERREVTTTKQPKGDKREENTAEPSEAVAEKEPAVEDHPQPAAVVPESKPAIAESPKESKAPVKQETPPPAPIEKKPDVVPPVAAAPRPTTPSPVTPPANPPEKPSKPATPSQVAPPLGDVKRASPNPPAQPASEPLGRFVSVDQVLLGTNASGDWTRLEANQGLTPQQLLAPPTYRGKVAMTGASLDIVGPTHVELLPPSAQEWPGIRILYGRVILAPQDTPTVKFRVAFGDRIGTITFTDVDSVVALDVRRVREPGVDPEKGPSSVSADLYVSAGGILWQEPSRDKDKPAEPLKISALQHVGFDAELTSPLTAIKELPKWITAQPISPLDHRASTAIEQALPTDRLARVGLLEVATSRPQKEVKWLALRCLACIGQFRDMVEALNDPSRKLDWADYYIDELRAAVARDAKSAAAVRSALETQYPQQAAELYRMLWGYTNHDLEGGEDAKLVQALSSETLAVRVLAIWNLKDITGLGWSYQPEQTAAKRKLATTRWHQRLEAKEIRIKSPEGVMRPQ